MFESLFEFDADADEATLRGIVARFEQLKAAAAAAQARATEAWATKRHVAEAAAGVPKPKRGRGLANEVALARHVAPKRGGQHLGFATALVREMPHTLAALECGALNEWRATMIVRESACLSIEHRRQLDAELCSDSSALEGWGDKRVAAEAKKIAVRLDAQAVVERSAKAADDRCVWIRPAPDTMAYLTVLLPVAQGVAVYATVRRQADTTFDGRSRGQVMADTVVERVTGRPAEQPVPVSLNLVMADTTLAGADDESAWLDGYGPVPAGFACKMVGDAALDEDARTTLRRLYRHPDSGQLVAMESRSRIFPRGLAAFIGMRDQTCRTPYCDAPIRHRDHARPHRESGRTSALNGLGECEACNYAKEARGWRVRTTERDGMHQADFTTPTGATYRSIAPPLPGPPIRKRVSIIESQLSVDLVTFDAA
ncbi:HNH endonuclease [Mycolicibacterium aichiense]|uniref:HNH endonuclease n=1 Tax=Mycolicibacterium aichiense TaxID=1799 RepID=UPI003D6693AF